MGGAKPFKSAVPERSGLKAWRGGLERERRKAEQGGAVWSNRRISAGRMRLMDLPAGYPRSPKPARRVVCVKFSKKILGMWAKESRGRGAEPLARAQRSARRRIRQLAAA